jgi:hypothetical protein
MYVILVRKTFEIPSGNGIVSNPHEAEIFLLRSYFPYFEVTNSPSSRQMLPIV